MRITKFLASGTLPFYLLPILMLYVAVGTVAQRYIGLFDAQKIFFNAPFILGILPGTPLILGIITLGLCVKFFFYSRWQWRRFGVHLAHLGVLVLLLSGIAISLTHQEGYMQLAKGETNHVLQDYHQRVLRINNHVIKFENLIAPTWPKNLPFKIKILKTCVDCQITNRLNPLKNARGMAKAVDIVSNSAILNSKNDEEKIYGVLIQISGLDKAQNGIYLLFDVLPQALIFKADKQFFDITLNRTTRRLPFDITLNKFTKITYPNSAKAKDYISDVTITDNNKKFKARIAMNEPLRYQNYTIYQSSMVQDNTGQTSTVLSATYHAGWYWSYIGTIIMAFGLLWHSMVALFQRGKK